MKRREFIGMAAAGAAGIVVPGVARNDAATRSAFSRPGLLQFFPERIVREIGRRYRRKVPTENDATVLTRALAAGASAEPAGWNVSPSIEVDLPHTDIAITVHDDFAAGHTVMVDGWILSLTEARQCALYSLQPA